MNKKYAIILVAILLIITTACEFSLGGDNSPSEEEINIELTRVSLQQTQTALALPPTTVPTTPTPENDADSDDPDDDQPGDAEDCYFSRWTGDETIPDGTKFDPNKDFVKSWTLRNEGTCDWTTDFRIVFEDGDQLGAPTSVYLTRKVKPGDTYTIEIPMKAPASDGNYTGVWRFKAADGTKMGKYWVKITVGDPAPPVGAFKVSSVPLTMADDTINIWCPGNEVVTITANITTNAAGMVSYKWDDSFGCAGCATKSIMFDSAGTKSISHNMTVGAAGSYWAKIYIDEPNHQWFGPKNFSVTCN